jgi:hypothetical protein
MGFQVKIVFFSMNVHETRKPFQVEETPLQCVGEPSSKGHHLGQNGTPRLGKELGLKPAGNPPEPNPDKTRKKQRATEGQQSGPARFLRHGTPSSPSGLRKRISF